MKIQGLSSPLGPLNLVQPRKEHQSPGRDEGGHRNSRGNPDMDPESNPDRENGEKSFSEQEMAAAVASFQADPQAQASGLSAKAEGDGPGLKVVLKDTAGQVIRQFTGEEFIRLRETVARDQRGRGKILDQKF